MRIGIGTVLAVMTLVLCGCALDQEFVGAVDRYAEVILPEYRAYVEEDSSITEETKRIRLQTADRFRALIDQAREKP